MEIIAGIIGFVLGGVLAWFLSRAKLKAESSALNERLENRDAQIAELKETLNGRDSKILELQEETSGLNADIVRVSTELAEERKRNEEKLKLLDESKVKLSDAFKNLATEIFEENNKKFKEINKDSLESLLLPLNEKIKVFQKKVEETHEKNIKDRSALVEKISRLHDLNQQLSKDAENLANALKGESKTQGNWGEMILERILESSGLQEGMEYETQVSMKDDSGRLQQPDVVVRLPDERCVIIDSKVSLKAYEAYCSGETEEEKTAALKAHLMSVKNHISNLSSKNYQSLLKEKSLDFVLMFMPVESAFAAAINEERKLFVDALNKNIVIVTPSTLLATLRTISHTWRQERQNRNAARIAREGGALYNKFVNFVSDLEKIGKGIDSTRSSYEDAMKKLKTGAGNLIRKTEILKALGAKTEKTLPDEVLEEAEAKDDLFLEMSMENSDGSDSE